MITEINVTGAGAEIITPAKINLTLAVGKKRSDGYHLISSVMMKIPLFDKVRVKKRADGALTVKCGAPSIPDGEKNIAFKAAKLFFEKTGISGGADITIEKNIPSCAGMGGGSSDAAAVITALDLLYGTGLEKNGKELFALGESAGADVPFFLDAPSDISLCEGIGGDLTRLSGYEALSSAFSVVIAKGEKGASTRDVYGLFDTLPAKRRDRLALIRALSSGKTDGLPETLFNDLEDAAMMIVPEIMNLKERMKSLGAHTALMTGSGSAVFGLFEKNGSVEKAEEALLREGYFAKAL